MENFKRLHLLATKCIITYTDMIFELSHIFSSSARTKVLEILVKHRTPLHMRRIAELSEFTVHAVDLTLRNLVRERLIHRQKAGQYLLFSPNFAKPEIKLVEELLSVKDKFVGKSEAEALSKAAAYALAVTDDLHHMKFARAPIISSPDLLCALAAALQEKGVSFWLSGDLPASMYRNDRRGFGEVRFEAMPSKKYDLNKAISAFLSEQPLFTETREVSQMARMYSLKPRRPQDSPISLRIVPVKEVDVRLNEITLNGQPISVLSIEDVILERAKSYLLDPEAYVLLDDLQNIFAANPGLDLTYLISRLQKEKVPLHPSILEDAPKLLQRVSREIIRAHGPYKELHPFH